MIFTYLDIKINWLGLVYGLLYLIPAVARGRMTQEKIGRFDRNDEGSREALGMGNCNINIWGGSELK